MIKKPCDDTAKKAAAGVILRQAIISFLMKKYETPDAYAQARGFKSARELIESREAEDGAAKKP